MKSLFICLILVTATNCVAQNVGIGTTTPKAAFNVAENKTVLFGLDTNGMGSKMIWYPSKAAFRAGSVDPLAQSIWDYSHVGYGSFASGVRTKANGEASTAMGYFTEASGDYSTAMGGGIASGTASTAMGGGIAFGTTSTAMGITTASGEVSTAMGYYTEASGDYSTSIGNFTLAKSFTEISIGAYNTDYTPLSTVGWNSADRLFTIGNGANSGSRSDAIVVLKNGNTGIGQSNPATAKLVIGGTNAQEGLDLSSDDQYANLRVIRNTLSSIDKDMYIGYESGATSSLHLYSNNNETLTIKGNKIGIGESNPIFPLNFGSNSGDKIALWGNSILSTNGSSIGFGVQNGLFQIHSNQLSDAIAFGYGSSSNFTEQMRIKGNGNVGIGTSNPGFPLNFADGPGDKISLWGNDPNGSSIGFGARLGLLQIHSYQASDDIAFGYGSSNNFTEQMRIKGTGNVGIGTNNPGYKLDVAGDINTSGQIRVNGAVFTSDARFKQNISTLPNALNNLLQLRGTNYFFNTNAFPERNFSADKQMGVIAQEVEKVFPELVSTDKEGYKSVNYIGLVPVMIESIKEQQTQIEKQNQQIEKLTRLVNQLLNK